MNLYKEERGFRNNNPGNIRHGPSQWLGLCTKQNDFKFCQFVSVEYGIRAMFTLLETYRNEYGLTTIEGVIKKWAPLTENETADYIESVSDYIQKYGFHIGINQELIGDLDYCAVIAGIIHQENGVQPFHSGFIMQCKGIK